METIIQFFIDQFKEGNHVEMPGNVVDALKQLNRAGRGDLKIRLFNEAKYLTHHDPDKSAIAWLENAFYLIEKHTFRYHKVLFSPGNDIPESLAFLLNQAVHTIDLCVFTISNKNLLAWAAGLKIPKMHRSASSFFGKATKWARKFRA